MDKSKNSYTIILIVAAFLFSFLLRLVWTYYYNDVGMFQFNKEFMLTSNDGYLWLSMVSNQDIFTNSSIMVFVSYFFYTILPFSLDTIAFYQSAILSSLVVVPIILLGKHIKSLEFGFVSALVASIAVSYYNRTMVGYFDTDMLNIVLAIALLYTLYVAIDTKDNRYTLYTIFFVIVYQLWYPQSYMISLGFLFIFILLIYYQYIKKHNIDYYLKLVTLFSVALIGIPIVFKIFLFIGIYFLLQKINQKYIKYLATLSFVLFIFTLNLDPIVSRIDDYIAKKLVDSYIGMKLYFYTVMQTIQEAGSISFVEVATRVSGNVWLFILSSIGYVWLLIRYRLMLLTLPLLGLGMLSYGIPYLIPSAGLRFSMYAVPVMAMGIGFLIVEVSKLISTLIDGDRLPKVVYYFAIVIFTLGVLNPHIKHIVDYKVSTILNSYEARTLKDLSTIAKSDDYVISWWDYGYPIRYYSGAKTLVDGGKHDGGANFGPSYILTSPLKDAIKIARLNVEYDKSNKIPFIEYALKDYDYKDSNKFLANIDSINPIKSDTDIYIYLPDKMSSIFTTIDKFSNIDLMSGKPKKEPFFYQSSSFADMSGVILLSDSMIFHKSSGRLQIKDKVYNINRFAYTTYTEDGKFTKDIQQIDSSSKLNIIYMKSYNKILILDNRLYESLYIQLFALQEYDKALIEPIILNPYAKVYKIKG
jgi:dolichyl-diphosphooligosaccharide--protein glycosyltransferase/undecaprenyl-diphosphooligosaccharide--protein glycosyltransferase